MIEVYVASKTFEAYFNLTNTKFVVAKGQVFMTDNVSDLPCPNVMEVSEDMSDYYCVTKVKKETLLEKI